jgi:CRISPR-associated protein Cas1
MSAARRLSRPLDGVALFHDVTAVEALTAGWRRVAENGGAAGGDGVDIPRFALAAASRLVDLSKALRDGSYRPGPLRRVEIPKKSGGRRLLTIPPIVDRVAQTAVAQRLAPLLDAEFEDASYAYRAGRGVADAVRRVEALRREGWTFAVDADIDDFFDTIPIDRLIDRLTRSMSESPLTDLVARWLEHGAEKGRGIAQGSPLSPLLANLYLDDLDETMSTGGLRLVRYADDFVVLTRDRPAAEAAFGRLEKELDRYGLKLDREKTRIRGWDESLKFLGTVFVRGWAMKASDDDPSTTPIEELMNRIARADAEAEAAVEAEDRASGAGLDRGIRLLHVGAPGRRLALRNLSFSVHAAADETAPGETTELLAVHPSRVDRIELGPRAEADLEALRLALAHAIPVAFVDGYGTTHGQLAPTLVPKAGRHLAQARALLDPERRLVLARALVTGRIANQRSLLRRINHRRGLAGVADVAARLGRIVRKTTIAETVDQAMGVEGEATALFWPAWGSLLLGGFAFGSRRRRERRDPVDIALDVLAGQLTRDVGAVILSVGLHPGFGILHTSSDAHDACVYDLMEEFRAGLIESVALTAINGGRLGLDMFSALPEGKLHLDRDGLGVLIRAYEERAEKPVTSPRSGKRVSWRRLMREQAEAFAKAVETGGDYHPYVLDN